MVCECFMKYSDGYYRKPSPDMTQGKAGGRLHGADAPGPRQRRRRDSAFLWAAMTMGNAFFRKDGVSVPLQERACPKGGRCILPV